MIVKVEESEKDFSSMQPARIAPSFMSCGNLGRLLFSQQIFIEHQLCARYRDECWDYVVSKIGKLPLCPLYFNGTCQGINT